MTNESLVLPWYEKIPSRQVDLVGDFAGANLFLLEGDSILLKAFSDPGLDFDHGFQLLHAVYLVERFLKQLLDRKCKFKIVFYEHHSVSCIPPGTSVSNTNKFLLARAVIIRHLRTTNLEIEVRIFPHVQDQRFLDYLAEQDVYFFMCHDGAGATPIADSTVHFRAFIRRFASEGYHIALINELHFKDSKVMVQILESGRRAQLTSAELDLETRNRLVPQWQDRTGASLARDEETGLISLWDLKLTDLSHDTSIVKDKQSTWRTTITYVALRDIANENPKFEPLLAPYLLHIVLLGELRISERRFEIPAEQASFTSLWVEFFDTVIVKLNEVISRAAFDSPHAHETTDLVDGRLFFNCMTHYDLILNDLPTLDRTQLEGLHNIFQLKPPAPHHGNSPLAPNARYCEKSSPVKLRPETVDLGTVLPFSNPIFDSHMTNVNTIATMSSSDEPRLLAHIFRDLTHWHNEKLIKSKLSANSIAKEKRLWLNQRYMAEMSAYAASLTNGSYKSLEPQVIMASPSTNKVLHTSSKSSDKELAKSQRTPVGQKQHQKEPKKPKLTSKARLLQGIQEDKVAKGNDQTKKTFDAWTTKRVQIEFGENAELRQLAAKQYLTALPSSKQTLIQNEVKLYCIQNLLVLWSRSCKAGNEDDGYGFMANIINLLSEVLSSVEKTKAEALCCTKVIKALGLPLGTTSSLDPRELSFDFFIPEGAKPLPLPWLEYLLQYFGPFMRRDLDSAPDERVSFEPDGWQRKVLDELDANKSVFVVAPTSSGKTFISFYAMEKILRQDDEGVLVYVAPTKALVNQISAEILARFQKKYPHVNHTTWAIHTRDYRVNNPTTCQILVTVPHILQILLLAPENAKKWAPRVRRIIFDEIHTIGQADDGLVWEQLLLLSPCPIIALSATVGNPAEFSDWVATTQKAVGVDLTMVQHTQRYSDLRKFKYVPPKKFAFHGLASESSTNSTIDLDPSFAFVHPIASLIGKTQMPEDLALEPRDCLFLWEVMTKFQTEDYPVPDMLSPKQSLPTVPKRSDIYDWERSLKTALKTWMTDTKSPFEEVVKALSRTMSQERMETLTSGLPNSAPEAQYFDIDEDDLFSTTFPLVCSLHRRRALPAILFNYDRSKCNALCNDILAKLEKSEEKWKATDAGWKAKVKAWEEWKKGKSKKDSRTAKRTKDDKKEGEKMSKSERSQDDAAHSVMSQWDGWDPSNQVDRFSFADVKKASHSELDEYIRPLRRRQIDPLLISALRRGVAVHHSGCNRKYRQTVEILFRKGYIRVVVATGTLALGINMPCVTTVFSGDSVFLTALNYRQSSGRAGRRGFDLLGNVVFQGIDDEKIYRLLSSRLPDLSGHFPLTTTLVLRLFSLLHNSDECEYAKKAITSLLSQPRIYLGGKEYKEQVLHHLRFSIEYLRRQSLLSATGVPINFASTVCHLYYTEASAFAFHVLLKHGYFHELSVEMKTNPLRALERLMLTMSNLFGRVVLRHTDEEFRRRARYSPSLIFLPKLESRAQAVLDAHNIETKNIFQSYVATYVDQHIKSADDCLPLTRQKAGGDRSNGLSLKPVQVRSSFVALSGKGDQFESVDELCASVRGDVFLEQAAIPKLGVEKEILNAYLYDYWKHFDMSAIKEDNGIREGEIWFLLNDFSLVLATIITSLSSYVKGPISELDFLDIQGSGDTVETTQDETVDKEEEVESARSKLAEATIQQQSRKPKVAESWEDEADKDEKTVQEGVNGSGSREDADDNLGNLDGYNLRGVLKMFQALREDFDRKFRLMWA